MKDKKLRKKGAKKPASSAGVPKRRKNQQETAIQKIVNHYFFTKGFNLDEIKKSAKKRKIIYSRFTRPAKQLLTLAGSIEKAQKAIDKVAEWANSRNLDYAIETVFKKWLELDRLKPKEVVKKPFFNDKPMVWSQTKRKWYVIDDDGTWLEFAGKEEEIEWRIAQNPVRNKISNEAKKHQTY